MTGVKGGGGAMSQALLVLAGVSVRGVWFAGVG